MKAIIMAGGEGSRLRPLTCGRPKPLVPVANRPVMEYAVELLKRCGITEIGVTLQYLPEAIQDWFGDGSQFGVELRYFVEEKPLGTAGSVKNAQEFLDETFLVVSGDALTDLNLLEAVKFHRDRGALATLVLTAVDTPLEYGVVLTFPDGRIEKFLEKPGWGEVFSDQVNTGIYVLEPEVLGYIPEGTMYDFSKDLFPKLLRENRPLYGCVLPGYWCDIGNLQQYQQAHYDILDGRVAVDLKATYQGDGIWLGKGVDLSPGARLRGPLILGDYVKVGPGATIDSYTVIGNNCKVGEGASLKKAVLWDGVYLANFTEVRGAVLCNRVILKAKSQVYEGAVIGDETSVAENSVIKPEVKVWPHKQLNQGITLNSSLVWGTKGNRNLFGVEGISGTANWDITPEFAAKLGAAYGSTLSTEQKVAVSSDGYAATQMLKTALIAGIVSAGVEVCDLGPVTMPVHRFAVRSLGAAGGMHVKLDTRDPEKVWMQFVDDRGIDFNRGAERKVENAFWREEYRRAAEGKIGVINYFPRFKESYRDYVVSAVDGAAIRGARFKIVIDYELPNLRLMLPNLLEQLGIKSIPFDTSFDHELKTFERVKDLHSFLAAEVIHQRADLGVIMDNNGERLFLIDDEGKPVDEERLMVLMSLVIFRSKPGATVAVPVTAPSVIDKLAARYNGKVLRTKTAHNFLLEKVFSPEIMEQQGKYQQAAFQFDAVQSLVKLLDFLAQEHTRLSELSTSIPEYFTHVQTTPCPWEAKGKVMRSLISEHQGDNIDLIDGIKIQRENGWALVLPHVEEPVYQVYGEGMSQEVAEELTNFYAKKIQEMVKSQKQ
ncbi:mannose-1-phosphate guanyltransferase [Zhaonella formicivorans]|uniref:mannose-1-phosphate guanyltransferase n=1 Tax=Zhaonella formicivorans TaxID=2528593 RepID=UPI0010DA2A71|nr:mannose-1-phosphate guanyltransferase [Zhaonella formicivorans]